MKNTRELLTSKRTEREVCKGAGEIFLIPADKPTGQPTYGPVQCQVCKKIYTVRDVRSHDGKLLDPPQRTVPLHHPKEK